MRWRMIYLLKRKCPRASTPGNDPSPKEARMNNSVSGIYQIRNVVNENLYIGSTVNIKKRWRNHISDLKNNKHHSRHLQNAWNKYSADVFEFSILETCSIFALIFREQHYINLYQPVYNNSPTAGSALGVKHTAETRERMSKASKKRFISIETRIKIGIAGRGRVVSPETRAKISLGNKGKTISQETRAKLSLIGKKKHLSNKNIQKLREGYQKYVANGISAEIRAKISKNNGSRRPDVRKKLSALLMGNKRALKKKPPSTA